MPAATGRWVRTCLAAACLLSLPPLGAQTAPPLTLKAAYDAALAFDAQYLASTHELESARQQIPQARALLLPNVGLTASASRVDGYREFANSLSQEVRVPLDYASPNASLTMRTPVFNAESRSRFNQAVKSVDAAEELFRARHDDLVNRVVDTYLQVLAAIDTHRLASAEVESLTGQARRSRQRLQRGEGTLTEVARAESALELSKSRVIEAFDALAVSRQALKRLIGVDARRLTRPGADFVPFALLPERQQDWMEMALRQNPLVRSREHELAVAAFGIDRARAGHLPRLDMVASISQGRNESPTNVNQTTSQRSVGVQLSVPIYAGGGVQAAVRQAMADRDRAEQALRNEREAVMLDIERYYRQAVTAPTRIEALSRVVKSSEIELKGALRAQEGGIGTLADVLDARTRLSSALRDLGQARLDFLEGRVRLMITAGMKTVAVLDELSQWMPEVADVPESSTP